MLSGLLLIVLTLPVAAQQVTPAAGPVSVQTTPTAPAQAGKSAKRTSPYQAADPATRARKMTDRMTTDLGLDPATAQKVYEAALTRAQKIDAIQNGTDDNKTKNQSLQANANAFKTALQSILSPDQFTKFQQQKGGRNRDKATGPQQPAKQEPH